MSEPARFGTNIDRCPYGYEYRRKQGTLKRWLCRKRSSAREQRIKEQLLQRLEGYRVALEGGGDTSGYFLSPAQRAAASALSVAMGKGAL